MSLTLFPITALLLLLSGVGAPTHAAGYTETIAALRKQFLSAVATPPRAAIATHRQASLVAWNPAAALVNRHESLNAAREIARNGHVRPWERKRYRTRFGFAEGAYLAVGPPAANSLVIFG